MQHLQAHISVKLSTVNRHSSIICWIYSHTSSPWSGCTMPGDLQNPNDFIEFLISANIRLVRAEFLTELDEAGAPMPRRQEAESMRTRSGATALVELSEYEELHVNQTSGLL